MATVRAPVLIQEELNPFQIAMQQFDRAAEHMKLDPGLREVLRRPRRAAPERGSEGTLIIAPVVGPSRGFTPREWR